MRGGGGVGSLTGLGVLHLPDAAVRGGPLVVVLGQGQGPSDAGPVGRLGAGCLGLLQAAVIVTVLGGVLQVLSLIGCGEGHSAVGEL